MKKKKKGGKVKWIIISVVVLIMVFAMADDTSSKESNTVQISDEQFNTSKAGTENSVDEQIVSVAESNTIAEPVIAENDVALTQGQQNALRSAKSYLDFTAFSYEGLIKQLEFEKYSHEEAVYAADNCGADWKEQAAKSAASYLEYSSFSREGLIDQLEYEGFTSEEAVYGVSANGY